MNLQAAKHQSLEILDIRCDLDAVTVLVDQEASARYQHLRYLSVRLTGEMPRGRHESTLFVETTVPGAERLAIPVLVDVP